MSSSTESLSTSSHIIADECPSYAAIEITTALAEIMQSLGGIRNWVLPGLLETGSVNDRIMAIQDGLVNFYVIKGSQGLVCIDAGWRPHCVKSRFMALGLDLADVAGAFLTHSHWDHARCWNVYTNASVFASGDADLPESQRIMRLSDGQAVDVGGIGIRAIATPGHTPDSLSFIADGRYLFTGDALRLRRGQVAAYPSRKKLARESARQSIRRLAELSGIEYLLTAHTGISRDLEFAFQNWRGVGERIEPEKSTRPEGRALSKDA